MRKIISILLVFLFVLSTTATSAFAEEKIKTFEGKVSIGGGIELNTKIMGKGDVSVVFDSGYGDGIYIYSEDSTHETWGNVQPEIAKYAKTIAYDRTGLGLSDNAVNRESLSDADIQTAVNGGTIAYDASVFESGTGKTSLDRARNLHVLLKNAKVKAPYLLVVHSISMLEAVEFAKEYHNELAGIVCVDGSWPTVLQETTAWANIYMPEIVPLFLGQFTAADGTLSEVIQSQLQVQNAGDVLRDIPLTVVHALDYGMGPEYQELGDRGMLSWLQWSDHSKKVLVPNSGHYIMVDQPQYVINAIKDMLDTIEKR